MLNQWMLCLHAISVTSACISIYNCMYMNGCSLHTRIRGVYILANVQKVLHIYGLHQINGKFECQKDMHFNTQLGPVAKNATPRLSAGNQISANLDLYQRSTDWATEAVAVSLGASSVNIQVVMPVKYKGILKTIFVIYTRWQPLKFFKV